MKPNQLTLDVECYKNYFLVKLKSHNKKTKNFELYEDHPLDYSGLIAVLSKFEILTFNGRGYDFCMVTLALSGASNASLKQASDRIIQEGLKPWDFYKQYGLQEPKWAHVDLIEPAPGVGASLKIYGGRIHSKHMQDLPIEPDAEILVEDRLELISYCGNDLDTTSDLYDAIEDRIELRRKMSEQYGINLLSKSDAQIAEAVIKSEVEKLTGSRVRKRKIVRNSFKYQPPEFIKFGTEQFNTMFEIICGAEFLAHSNGKIDVSEEFKNLKVNIGKSTYQIGLGGLHSTEHEVSHTLTDKSLIIDADVASYYPSLILQLGMYPEALGPEFLTIFKQITETRLIAKKNKDKIVNDSMKIMINGTFGKLGSVYSIFYAANLLLQTTITGQLALLMLIEMLERCGIPVISANTDGIVMNFDRQKEDYVKQIIAAWEKRTGLEMEFTYYKGIYNRDVNNYIAITIDGKVKTKGVFSPAGLQKNPTNEICSDALVAYLKDGTSFEETLRECKDIRKFLSVRKVNGGAVIGISYELPEHTKKLSREQIVKEAGYIEAIEGHWSFPGSDNLTSSTFEQAYAQSVKKLSVMKYERYLGKAIRWYYAKGVEGTINYKTNGNTVPRSEGAKPCMTLPDEFPDDIDYDWYLRECNDFLMDIGLVRRPHPEKIPRKNCKAWLQYLANGDIIPDPENSEKYIWSW